MLTELQRTQYFEQGFTIVNKVYSEAEVDSVIFDFHEIIKANLLKLGCANSSLSKSLFVNLQKLLAIDTGVYLSCLKHAAKLVSLQQITCNKNIQALAKLLDLNHVTTPTSPVLHLSSEKLKIPNGYFGVGEHQDWTSIQGGIKSLVVWTPFMDVDKKNFPLEILPGSHLKGLMKGKIEENSYAVDSQEFDESAFVRVPVQSGDIVLMSVFTLHRTAIKDSSGFRLACSMRYEDSLEPQFIERGYPCAYQRTINREFITPDYPSENEVRNYFKT